MLRMNIISVVTVASVALLAQSATAQNTQRRERLRKAVETGAAIGAKVAENAPDGHAVNNGFKGDVVVFEQIRSADAEPAEGRPAKEVNVGGLVIVQVDDTGSRPTKFSKATIEPEGAFQRLGRVRGIRTNDEGEDMMGGGYTWLLLKPIQAGEATVSVTYTPNGGDGKAVTQSHKVTVVEREN